MTLILIYVFTFILANKNDRCSLAAKIIYSNLYRQSNQGTNNDNLYNSASGMNKPNFERIKRPATLIKPIITSSPSPLATTSNDETNDYNGTRQPLSFLTKQSAVNNNLNKLSKQPIQNLSTKPQYSHADSEDLPPPPATLTQNHNQHSHQSSKH
jgi:hypothetical protein